MLKEDNIYYYEFPKSEISISPEQIITGMGYSDKSGSGLVENLIDEYLEAAKSIIALKGGFRILEEEAVSVGLGSFSINGIIFEAGKIITGHLKKSKTAALFAVTAGEGIDELTRKLTDEQDLLAAFVVSAIGSEAAEFAAGKIEELLEAEISKYGWKHTNRLSPGYCGWSVSEQHKLFSLLPAGFAGITLTKSALMTPIKSVSGIIGIGPDVIKKDYTCSICDLQNCFRRK
jgi:hypothetical protein